MSSHDQGIGFRCRRRHVYTSLQPLQPSHGDQGIGFRRIKVRSKTPIYTKGRTP